MTSVTVVCAYGGVVARPVAVDLTPGSLHQSWELFSPGAYPGYARSKPAEKIDGISILLVSNRRGVYWKATARLVSGQSVTEEGQL